MLMMFAFRKHLKVLKAVIALFPVVGMYGPALRERPVSLFPDEDVFSNVGMPSARLVRVRHQDIAVLVETTALPIRVVCTTIGSATQECDPAIVAMSLPDGLSPATERTGVITPDTFADPLKSAAVKALARFAALGDTNGSKGLTAVDAREGSRSHDSLWPRPRAMDAIPLVIAGRTALSIAALGHKGCAAVNALALLICRPYSMSSSNSWINRSP